MPQEHDTILVQFFQHAHHRAEGWLMDFQEELAKGRLEDVFLERASADIRKHLYVEEELLFPRVGDRMAEPVADLLEDHGYIADLIEELGALASRRADLPHIQQATARLLNFLASHSAKEDMGVYPDLVAMLGPAASLALLAEADEARLPEYWRCRRRRGLG